MISQRDAIGTEILVLNKRNAKDLVCYRTLYVSIGLLVGACGVFGGRLACRELEKLTGGCDLTSRLVGLPTTGGRNK